VTDLSRDVLLNTHDCQEDQARLTACLPRSDYATLPPASHDSLTAGLLSDSEPAGSNKPRRLGDRLRATFEFSRATMAHPWGREPLLAGAGRDLWYALRRLRGAPVFSLFTIVSLSIAIGTATAVYAVVHAVMGPPPGIAIALGATAWQIRQMVIREGLDPVMRGLATGCSLAVLVALGARATLYGLDRTRPARRRRVVRIGGCAVRPGWRGGVLPPRAPGVPR
jgi:hypothetical protein